MTALVNPQYQSKSAVRCSLVFAVSEDGIVQLRLAKLYKIVCRTRAKLLAHHGAVERVPIGAGDRIIAEDGQVAAGKEAREEALEKRPYRAADVRAEIEHEIQLRFLTIPVRPLA